MASVWIPIGACAWLGASFVAGVFMSRVAALGGPDGTTLMKSLPIDSSSSTWEQRVRAPTTRSD
jgi:hypothetical protein